MHALKSIIILALAILLIKSPVLKAQDLLAYADSLRLANHIPEIAFAVIQPDTMPESGIAGYHRMDRQDEYTKGKSGDYFHLGSNTKAITGFVAAHLVEQGKISWKTKFFDLFPSWKKNSNPAYWHITLQDLLTHKAGIQAYTDGAEFARLPEFTGEAEQQRMAFCRHILRQAPKNKKRRYEYSNAGYSFVALMLEKVSGKTWEKLSEETLNQLGLHPLYGWPNKFSEDQPHGHWIENDTLRVIPGNSSYNLALIEPAGDISMTLPGYAKFIQYNLQGLCGRDNFLKASTYEFLHYGCNGYAIGWQNIQDSGNQFSEHAGSAGTFYCYTVIDKTRRTAYIVMVNSTSPEAKDGLFKLLNAMSRKYD